MEDIVYLSDLSELCTRDKAWNQCKEKLWSEPVLAVAVDHRVEPKSWKIEHQPFFLICTISNTWQQNNPNGRYTTYNVMCTWMCNDF